MKDINNIQHAPDALALALPDGFRWPEKLRSSYERACRSIDRIKVQGKHKPA